MKKFLEFIVLLPVWLIGVSSFIVVMVLWLLEFIFNIMVADYGFYIVGFNVVLMTIWFLAKYVYSKMP